MSAIQGFSIENALFEDKGFLDPSYAQAQDLGLQTTLIKNFSSGAIVALAETIHFIGYAALFGLSVNFLGKERVCFHYCVAGFFKLLENKTYTKDDIEKFDNRPSYLQNFQEKTERVKRLSAKDQMFWFFKESFANTIFKVMAAALILQSPTRVVWNFRAIPLNLLRCTALAVGLSYVTHPLHLLLDYAEGKMHSFVYHKAENQRDLLV